MPKPKTLKQEELRQIIGSHITPIRDAAQSLAKLLEMFGRSADFTFTELECTNKALESLDYTKGALKEIKAAMALRARTKVAEVCK